MPTRTRTRGGFTYPTITHIQHNCDGTSVTSTGTTGSLLSYGVYEEMTDFVTPGFRKIQGRGGVVFSNMTKVKEERVAIEGSAVRTRIGACGAGLVKQFTYTSVNDYMLGLPQYATAPDLTDMEDEARTKALANANTPDILGLVDLVEARSTITGLADTVRSFSRLFEAIRYTDDYDPRRRRRTRRRARRTTAETLDHISSNWLRYRYLFIPLLLEANSVLELYRKGLKPKGFRQTYRSSVQSSSNGSEVLIQTLVSGSWTTKLYAKKDVLSIVRGGCLQEILKDRCLSVQLGLHPAYVGQAAWELLRFSFVLDWFVNVGDLVAAASPQVGSRILGVWTTSTVQSSISWRTVTTYGGSGWAVSTNSSTGVAVKTTTDRKSGGSATFTPRTFQARWLDLIHLSDAVALLKQTLR